MSLSLATYHPNSFLHRGRRSSFFETLDRYSNTRVFRTSTFAVGVGCSRRTSAAVTHPEHASAFTLFSVPTVTASAGRSAPTPAQNISYDRFRSSAFPLCSLDEHFQNTYKPRPQCIALLIRFRQASLSMRGGSGEASQKTPKPACRPGPRRSNQPSTRSCPESIGHSRLDAPWSLGRKKSPGETSLNPPSDTHLVVYL